MRSAQDGLTGGVLESPLPHNLLMLQRFFHAAGCRARLERRAGRDLGDAGIAFINDRAHLQILDCK